MGHGGRRPGAGAKPLATREAKKNFFGSLLTDAERKELWRKYLFSIDHRIGLSALTYVTDQAEGKAAQALKHSGDEAADPIKVLLIGSKGEHAIQ